MSEQPDSTDPSTEPDQDAGPPGDGIHEPGEGGGPHPDPPPAGEDPNTP
jgi:hypothetical protein